MVKRYWSFSVWFTMFFHSMNSVLKSIKYPRWRKLTHLIFYYFGYFANCKVSLGDMMPLTTLSVSSWFHGTIFPPWNILLIWFILFKIIPTFMRVFIRAFLPKYSANNVFTKRFLLIIVNISFVRRTLLHSFCLPNIPAKILLWI